MNKKAQTGGLITGLVFGVAALVIGVIVALVITSTLSGAGLLEAGRTTGTTINETGYVNSTGYTLGATTNTSIVSGSYSITAVLNTTSGGTVLDAPNYTVSSSGVVKNATAVEFNSTWITYSYSYYTDEEISTNRLTSNFTQGISNVSNKIPTVLLIAAIVLILGVLAVLVGVWQRMRMGSGGI